MKWPIELVIVRHGQSEYNILRDTKAKDPLYQQFVEAYEKDFQSTTTIALAQEVNRKFGLARSDADTALTGFGEFMAFTTGQQLSGMIGLPDAVFVSPYLRTLETLKFMSEAWPALCEAKVVPEDRIREQEHGLQILYNDWRVFNVMHPEQKRFRALQGDYWYQYPQGESVSQVRDRIRSFLGTLVREYAEKRVMLVTHHLTLLSIRATLERLTPKEFIRINDREKPVNCGVTIYRGNPELGRDGRLELEIYNRKLY